MDPQHSSPSTAVGALGVLILAGGHSSRMGRDKALVEIGGKPMLRRVWEAARGGLGAGAPSWAVTPWPERYRELLPGCIWIEERYSEGPFAAFLQALPHIQSEWVLVLACDLPDLEAGVIGRWARALGGAPDSALAALVPSAKGWEPLCGFYRRRCFSSAMQYLAEGGRSFQGWLERIEIFALAADRDMLRNCNTPEDLSEEGERAVF
ncbi:molybdenum cofactor guanylyltransferase [Gloeobacter violaceus]|uniref:molybdenum cofactor guanylyltransferase n=1 Tax=Gloeobacter violaceus TaxID=33072 RepID=UPI0018D3D3C7|nr:molybdenum cofactor guanylyltransferase [Gloeobacter violaceus]